MKKYFRELAATIDRESITADEISRFRAKTVDEMMAMGASEQELALLQDAAIRNSIRKNATPKDLAWAMLQ